MSNSCSGSEAILHATSSMWQHEKRVPFLSHSSLLAIQALKEQEAGFPMRKFTLQRKFGNRHKPTRWNMAHSSVDLVGVNTVHVIHQLDHLPTFFLLFLGVWCLGISSTYKQGNILSFT